MNEATTEATGQGRRLALVLAVSKQGWVLVAAWLLVLFYVTSYLLPHVPSADLNIYFLQPLLWSSLGIVALVMWRREARGSVFPLDRGVMAAAAVVALFQISLFVMAGILAGFGHSPYAHRPHLMALNVWFVGTRLVGLELARWYLILALGRRSLLLGAGAAWLLLSLVAVPPANFSHLGEAEKAFRLSGATLLPAASENLLSTYLVLVGGPLASIAYRGSLAAFEWLSPILPNIKWTITALLGTLAPIIGLLVVRDFVQWRAEGAEGESVKGTSWGTSLVLFAALAVFIFWFNTGLFGVRPLLVSGHSMEPALTVGDIAITREISPGDVEVGDMIRYKHGDSSVLHRVQEIRQEGHQTVFVLKGDANNVADDPIVGDQIESKVVFVIPEVGWVPIYLGKLLDRLR